MALLAGVFLSGLTQSGSRWDVFSFHLFLLLLCGGEGVCFRRRTHTKHGGGEAKRVEAEEKEVEDEEE